MENIAPVLDLIIELRFGLEKGQPVKKILSKYISSLQADMWQRFLVDWINGVERGEIVHPPPNFSIYKKQLVEILKQGVRGQPILQQIILLEEEALRACTFEIEEKIATLPIKSLIPLLLFQFPAIVLLMLGPFVSKLSLN